MDHRRFALILQIFISWDGINQSVLWVMRAHRVGEAWCRKLGLLVILIIIVTWDIVCHVRKLNISSMFPNKYFASVSCGPGNNARFCRRRPGSPGPRSTLLRLRLSGVERCDFPLPELVEMDPRASEDSTQS